MDLLPFALSLFCVWWIDGLGIVPYNASDDHGVQLLHIPPGEVPGARALHLVVHKHLPPRDAAPSIHRPARAAGVGWLHSRPLGRSLRPPRRTGRRGQHPVHERRRRRNPRAADVVSPARAEPGSHRTAYLYRNVRDPFVLMHCWHDEHDRSTKHEHSRSDEAPALATFSLLPILNKVSSQVG